MLTSWPAASRLSRRPLCRKRPGPRPMRCSFRPESYGTLKRLTFILAPLSRVDLFVEAVVGVDDVEVVGGLEEVDALGEEVGVEEGRALQPASGVARPRVVGSE